MGNNEFQMNNDEFKGFETAFENLNDLYKQFCKYNSSEDFLTGYYKAVRVLNFLYLELAKHNEETDIFLKTISN